MESEQLENHFIQPLFRYSFIPTFRFFNFYVNVHQWLNETISMTYLRSQSVAILAFDEYRAEIRGIIVWGRIWCRWGFAFKWVAVSAEALQLLYRGFTASSLFMNKKSGMKPEEWVVFVLSSVLRQNASRTLFYRLFPFLCSHSLSLFFFSISRDLQGSWTLSPPTWQTVAMGIAVPWWALCIPHLIPRPQSYKQTPIHSLDEEKTTTTPQKSKHAHFPSHWTHAPVHPFCTSTSSVKYSWCITTQSSALSLSHSQYNTVFLEQFFHLSCL